MLARSVASYSGSCKDAVRCLQGQLPVTVAHVRKRSDAYKVSCLLQWLM